MLTKTNVQIHLPAPIVFDLGGSESTSFSVEACGTGSFTGLAYTIPAHASGKLKAAIQVMALTSADMEDLNKMIMGLLSASKQQQVKEYVTAQGSGSISLWRLICGGAQASASKTTETMTNLGLTKEQITKIIDSMFEMAKKMSRVQLDFTIDNSKNDYNVSGDLQLYTISGTINSSKGTAQYRMLADQGTAGGGSASAKGDIIPLS
jgi:hypothetical protein